MKVLGAQVAADKHQYRELRRNCARCMAWAGDRETSPRLTLIPFSAEFDKPYTARRPCRVTFLEPSGPPSNGWVLRHGAEVKVQCLQEPCPTADAVALEEAW